MNKAFQTNVLNAFLEVGIVLALYYAAWQETLGHMFKNRASDLLEARFLNT